MADVSFKVNTHGPLFNGAANRAVTAFLGEAKQEVADEGVNVVHQRLDMVLQNPTGHYESQITTEQHMNDIHVTDQQMVYGPWLEGTGSRNKTTRFKGYATFRKTTQDLQRRLKEIVNPVLNRYMGRMG
jgi:hypothetical protein